MAISASSSTLPSLKSDRTTRLAAFSSSSSSSSSSWRLSFSSSLQFPLQLRRLRICHKGVSTPSRARLLPMVIVYLFIFFYFRKVEKRTWISFFFFEEQILNFIGSLWFSPLLFFYFFRIFRVIFRVLVFAFEILFSCLGLFFLLLIIMIFFFAFLYDLDIHMCACIYIYYQIAYKWVIKVI